KLLFNLNRMPVATDAVSSEVVIYRGEMGRIPRFYARSCRAGLGIYNHRMRFDKTCGKKRCQGQDGGGGITARISHQCGRFYLVFMKFRQAVNCPIKSFRKSVCLMVPLLINFRTL